MTELPLPDEPEGDTGPLAVDTNPDAADLPDEVPDGDPEAGVMPEEDPA